jgi:hypothetical protein
MVGLAPEGRDIEEELGEPPENAGRFIALLVGAGLPILPVGVTEGQGRMRVAFGALFRPEIPAGKGERDERVAGEVMGAIGRVMKVQDT